jgi:hypothetical protein
VDEVPAGSAVTGAASSLLSAAEGLRRRGLGDGALGDPAILSGLPLVGGLLGSDGKGGGLLKRVTRRALTSMLSNVPAVSSLASTAGGALEPVTGSVPEVEGLAQGVPGGDAVVGLANAILGAAEGV